MFLLKSIIAIIFIYRAKKKENKLLLEHSPNVDMRISTNA